MRANKFLIGLVLFSLVTAACRHRRSAAIGGTGQIIVFADSSAWASAGMPLRQAIERIRRTPRAEKEFTIRYEPASLFRTYQKYAHVILLGTLDADGDICRSIRPLMNAEAEKAVRTGDAFYFARKDEWADGQMVVVLASADTVQLVKDLRERGAEIFQIFDAHTRERISDDLFAPAGPGWKDSAAVLFDRFGWWMRVPGGYGIVDVRPDYVRFHAGVNASQRWISVWWTDSFPDSVITRAWTVAARNALGARMTDPVSTDPVYDAFWEARLNGTRALAYDGVWKTRAVDNAYGGPFRCFVFHEGRRVFFLDGSVFCPEENNKLKFLRELDVILRTFSTRKPL